MENFFIEFGIKTGSFVPDFFIEIIRYGASNVQVKDFVFSTQYAKVFFEEVFS